AGLVKPGEQPLLVQFESRLPRFEIVELLVAPVCLRNNAVWLLLIQPFGQQLDASFRSGETLDCFAVSLLPVRYAADCQPDLIGKRADVMLSLQRPHGVFFRLQGGTVL